MQQIPLISIDDSVETYIPDMDVSMMDLDEKVDRFKQVIRNLFLSGKRALVATSMGKDSSVMCSITAEVLVEMMAKGELGSFSKESPAVVFTHSNTLVENPVASKFALSECEKLNAFIDRHNLPAQVNIVEPSLSNNYLVNIIGGRTVATLPGMGSKCSSMMKVEPITRHKKRIFKTYGKDDVFTMIATRRDESSSREGNMKKRGESETELVLNDQGEWLLSPIADFTLDDVFMYIAEVRNGLHVTYSDFEELVENYRDFNSGECMVNVYANNKPSKSGCSSRSGCWTCLKVSSDKSLNNMIKEEKFKWMAPLGNLRNLIQFEHWNPDKRRWMARKLNDDGTINLLPVSYSAEFCKDLLKYALTIQLREYRDANRMGIAPRFVLLRDSDVIGIQMLWSRYGFHKGAEALEIWRDIMIHGNEYDIPYIDPDAVSPYTRKDIRDDDPELRNLPFADADFKAMFNGFRDIEAAVADCERTVTKQGVFYSEAMTGKEFEIDEEAAMLLLDFELDYVIEKAKDRYSTAVFHTLIRMGTVTLKRGSESEQSRMLSMANQIERLNIRGMENKPFKLAKHLRRIGEKNA